MNLPSVLEFHPPAGLVVRVCGACCVSDVTNTLVSHSGQLFSWCDKPWVGAGGRGGPCKHGAHQENREGQKEEVGLQS